MNSRVVALLLPAVVLAGCASTGSRTDAAPSVGPPATEIPERLHASTEAWNRGDLDGFLDPYLDASETTFVGASGLVHGLDEVRAGYASGYWADGVPEQTLRFGELDVRRLGSDHALATGRYILTDRASGQTVGSGFFSLVWRRTADGWRIIHDHSSADEL